MELFPCDWKLRYPAPADKLEVTEIEAAANSCGIKVGGQLVVRGWFKGWMESPDDGTRRARMVSDYIELCSPDTRGDRIHYRKGLKPTYDMQDLEFFRGERRALV